MNILDIAIAKKLAGGGGGSGTDNYNDLSNLPKINDTTLSGNKSSSALGLQSEINSDSKLASDLVDDTNQDNKFVTSTEKNTWNAKQNAIDSDHKLSSDLVDDANHTNKFVTSTEKQTWNAKQNAIDADHKLSSSLVSFSEAEAAAIASGIDSSKVGQISTNQSNILYGLQTGVKNLFDLKNADISAVTNISVSKTDTSLIVTTTGEKKWSHVGIPIELEAGTYHVLATIRGRTADASAITRFIVASSAGGTSELGGVTFTNNGSIDFQFTTTGGTVYLIPYPNYSSTGYNATFTASDIMICTKAAWDQEPNVYQPFALPNYDLTRLEAEDRAALAEEIDAGAKNKFPPNDFQGLGTVFTIVNNHDGTYKVNGSTSSVSLTTFAEFSVPAGTYILSGCPSGGSSDTGYSLDLRTAGGSQISGSEDLGSGSDPFTLAAGIYRMTIRFAANYTAPSAGLLFKPMICTKAAFGVSNKFVPYRPNYDFVCSGRVAPRTSATLTSGNLNDFPTSYYLCTGAVANLPEYTGYAIVKTIVIDENAALQEAFTLNSSGNKSYMRTKWNGTWNPWVLNTNVSS